MPAPAAPHAEAKLLIEADTGKVLHAENATYPWYPASVTKLMTTYMTLRAIKEGRITLDTLFTVWRNAAAQQPTKMGFKVGTQVTVDNALKMLMVKSANDMAVMHCRRRLRLDRGIRRQDERQCAPAGHDAEAISSIRTACRPRTRSRRPATSASWRAR